MKLKLKEVGFSPKPQDIHSYAPHTPELHLRALLMMSPLLILPFPSLLPFELLLICKAHSQRPPSL